MTSPQIIPTVCVSSPERLRLSPEPMSRSIEREIQKHQIALPSPAVNTHGRYNSSDEDDEDDDDDDEDEVDDDDSEGSPGWSTSTSFSAGDSPCSVVESYDDLVTPAEVKAEIKISKYAENLIQHSRQAIADVISGKDDKLIVVVGPCSIHNVEAALHYAQELKAVESQFPNLVIVMRTYFEKPRTTVGWKGLINDPDLDGSFQLERLLVVIL